MLVWHEKLQSGSLCNVSYIFTGKEAVMVQSRNKIMLNDEYFHGLVQERHNSIADALELRLSCINPSILCWQYMIICYPTNLVHKELVLIRMFADLFHRINSWYVASQTNSKGWWAEAPYIAAFLTHWDLEYKWTGSSMFQVMWGIKPSYKPMMTYYQVNIYLQTLGIKIQ